jgi:hypothetical protein
MFPYKAPHILITLIFFFMLSTSLLQLKTIDKPPWEELSQNINQMREHVVVLNPGHLAYPYAYYVEPE